MEKGELASLTAAVTAAVNELLAFSITSNTDDEVLAAARAIETARRRLETFDHALINEICSRALPDRTLTRSAAGFLSGLLNLSASEANRRVKHSRALSPSKSLTGELVPATCPVAGTAREAGQISDEHVHVIVGAIDKLPRALPVDTIADAEQFLADWATKTNPTQLRNIAMRLRDTLDPDGMLTDTAGQRRRRGLTLTATADGMHKLSGELDPVCAAVAATVLNALSAPKPSDASGPDDRTPAQRRHDALQAVLNLALRADQLPMTGGTPATVLITVTADQLTSKLGLAETSFGQLLDLPTALRLADQAALAVIVNDAQGKPLMLGREKRLASPHQVLALVARDRGCSFPGCTTPPEWTEKHHIIPWSQGGRTDLDNLCLLCDYHHDRHLEQGWTIQLRQGIAWFVPPAWQDPERVPLRNQRFDLDPAPDP